MNKEIKFRYWDNMLKSFVFSDEFAFLNKYEQLEEFFSRAKIYGKDTVQQFSGIIDSNKNEIYDGDFVKTERGGRIIIWDQNLIFIFNTGCFKVGNIFQNTLEELNNRFFKNEIKK